MRRTLRAIGAVLVVLLGFTACSNGAGANGARYEIAGGYTSGIYYSYGKHFAKALRADLGMNIEVTETQGSVENLKLVSSGQALLGFAQGDAAVDAIRGEGNFSEPLQVRAIARVYDEFVHVVVPADSEVTKISDLAGRTVSLGANDSGVQVIATRVLDAAGVDPNLVTNLPLGLDASIDAVQRGEIEGFFWVGGVPTPGIEELEQSMPIRLLSIEADVVERASEDRSGVYQLADFPIGFYGLDTPTVTMTVPNYLMTAEDAPAELISDVVRVLFESRTALAEEVTAAGYLDLRRAIFTGPLDLHAGAAEYYVDMRR